MHSESFSKILLQQFFQKQKKEHSKECSFVQIWKTD
ncbi:hypothetical protein H702_10100 [Streptococcus equinus JB1]|uniref:Uncharacterized protein n=1 Tax=Streptococcus equinus JB1 TaxID=1294274 RepID=A0A091BLW9_STREI|nr:hypothetical protein H702_10100 [Streptococcus equinus JB1]